MATAARSKQADPAVKVLWEDQQQICHFGRINARCLELQSELAAAKTELDNLESAECDAMEAMVTMPGKTRLAISTSFVLVDDDTISSFVDSEKVAVQAKIEGLEARISTLDDEMKLIKARLYAKFGSAIYLENE